jgi:hypothetical protein
MTTRPQDEAAPFEDMDQPLSPDHLRALQQACAPVGVLHAPPADVVRALRQHGYVEIVLGGVQITPSGLERLLRERKRNPRSVQP